MSAIVFLPGPVIGNNRTAAYAHSVCTVLPWQDSAGWLQRFGRARCQHGSARTCHRVDASAPSGYHVKPGRVPHTCMIVFQVTRCSSNASAAASTRLCGAPRLLPDLWLLYCSFRLVPRSHGLVLLIPLQAHTYTDHVRDDSTERT